MNYTAVLSELISTRRAVIGIVGVGYVGGPLARESAGVGFQVIGFTRSVIRANRINRERIRNLTITTDTKKLSGCNIICICVPTPIHQDKSPDLEPVLSSVQKTVQYMQKGTLVIIESTIAPGTTRNIILPILKSSGFSEEKDFFLSFSPERVDPGNVTYNLKNTPKVISGLSRQSVELSCQFYQSFVKEVVPVSSLETAEMSKILENTFRFVNISLMNELLDYTNKIGIDMWEVIAASATKPYGFMPHYPGPGVGGHCIPVDPYYLLDDARKRNVKLGILEQTGLVNDAQPYKVLDKTLSVLKQTNGHKQTNSALIVGLAYKENIDDKRESPSIKIWELLKKNNVNVSYHDPYILRYENAESEEISELSLQQKDIIIIVTPHRCINYKLLMSSQKPIIDTRNVLKDTTSPNIYRI
jgi:UDP-N-acetyl-D-glucosamine dehydrogenase